MKRMNEVFELPIRYVDAVSFTVNLTKGETEAIAHAINNVDALAKNLEAMVDGNWVTYHERQLAHLAAKAALQAYRGTK